MLVTLRHGKYLGEEPIELGQSGDNDARAVTFISDTRYTGVDLQDTVPEVALQGKFLSGDATASTVSVIVSDGSNLVSESTSSQIKINWIIPVGVLARSGTGSMQIRLVKTVDGKKVLVWTSEKMPVIVARSIEIGTYTQGKADAIATLDARIARVEAQGVGGGDNDLTEINNRLAALEEEIVGVTANLISGMEAVGG